MNAYKPDMDQVIRRLRQPNEPSSAGDAEPHMSALSNPAAVAAKLQQAFRGAAIGAIDSAHAANLPVPVLGDDGTMVWLHPDGVVRPDRNAGKPLVGRGLR